MQGSNKHIFFEGLNGLRFFAALAVIITHVELIKHMLGINNYWSSTIVFNLGSMGVYFFFVLSGFLITYLLLVEKETTNAIAIKKFYWRRVLRIWPLYYLIVMFGFFVLPKISFFDVEYQTKALEENFFPNLMLYLVILPNVAFSMFVAVPNIGQTWSIGVEEQFYVVWPWVVKYSKNILNTLFYVILFLIMLKVIVLFLGKYYSTERWYEVVKKLVAMSKFECMAIGGLGAVFLYNKHSFLDIIRKKWITITSIIFTILIILYIPDQLKDGQHLIISVFFLIIILNVAQGQINWLKVKVLDYLGQISYGLYMYHFLTIPLVTRVILYYVNPSHSVVLFNILVYSIVIFLSILISSASYYLFELKFIKLKGRFSSFKTV